MLDQQDTLSWLPPYTLKRSSRARLVQLKVSLRQGLEVVIPDHYNTAQLPQVFSRHRHWIEKKYYELTQRWQKYDPEPFPSQLQLRAVDSTWTLGYREGPLPWRLINSSYRHLDLIGQRSETRLLFASLKHWVKEQAKFHLFNHLVLLSAKTGLDFKTATIRDQRSRWGSCSSKKVINLNYKLIFLPPELMRHVLIHELCHTVYLNHSRQFWQLVESFDPDYQQHRQRLREAELFIPQWL